jgi:transcriptional regulator with XRE-family HTH domain
MPKSEPESQQPAQGLGAYLNSLRKGLGMSLRDVEEATNNEVSNAYLSQLETGKITKPSPNILYALATLYGVSYAKLMERAGYVSPSTKVEKRAGNRHGRAATFAVDNLTAEEEAELLKYLAWYRSHRRSGGS